jgi:putative MATE family efflux protein
LILTKDREFYRRLIQLAVPICLQSMVMIGISLVDTLIVGQLGETALSATALANQFGFIFLVICFGIVGGACVMTGQFWGNQDTASINKTMAIAFQMTTALSLLFFLLAQLFPREILSIYSNEAAVIEQGAIFLRVISFSFLFLGWSTVASWTLRSVGVVRLTLLTAIITFVNNLILNWILVFGNLGAPAMGVAGSALATTMARTLEIIVILGYLLLYDRKIKFRLKYLFKSDRLIFREYMKVGAPVIISDFILVVGMSMLSVIMGHMGSEMVAANSITNVLTQLTTVLLMGISSSSTIIIGNTVGAGDMEKAQDYAKTLWFLSIMLGLAGSFLIFFLKYLAVDFYEITVSTRGIALQLMDAMAMLMIFTSVSQTLTKGILRAGGDTRFLMVADVLFLWLASIPLGYLAGIRLDLAPGIVFICLKIDEVIKAIWCSRRLLGQRWIKNVAREIQDLKIA